MATNGSDIVIAMDCFRGNEPGSLMVKKLAISNATNEGLESFLFLPQTAWNDLNEAAKKANNFSSRFIHNLQYNSGYIEYDKLNQILVDYTDGADTIFTKGSQNAKFLADILGCPVVDIDELGISKNRIQRIKKHQQPIRCLEDHTRRHSTAGFDGPSYACCIERVNVWTNLVRSYRYDLERGMQEQQTEPMDFEDGGPQDAEMEWE